MAFVAPIVSAVAGAASAVGGAAAGIGGIAKLAIGAAVIGSGLAKKAAAKDAAAEAQRNAGAAAEAAAKAAAEQADAAKAAAQKAAAARKAANLRLAETHSQEFAPLDFTTANLQTGIAVNFRSPVAFHRTIYGRTRVGGPIVYINGTGEKNEYLHLVIILAAHECAGVDTLFFNHDEVPFDQSSGSVSGKYAGHARVKVHLGADDQPVDAQLLAENSNIRESDTFSGRCYLYVRLLYDEPEFDEQGNLTDEGLFPAIPQISAIVRGRKVYDPREEKTEWSDNPALCVADYLEQGPLAVDRSFILQDDLIAAAEICDETVPLRDGGETKRYTANGQFLSSETPEANLNDLAQSMAGSIIYVGGRFSIQAGKWKTPTLRLCPDHLLDGFAISFRDGLNSTANTMKGLYTDPENFYQQSDYPFQVNEVARLNDGFELIQEIDLPFTNHHAMAQRIASIELASLDFQESFSLVVDVRQGLQVHPDDTILLDVPDLDFSDSEFRVISWKLKFRGVAIVVELDLRRTSPEVFEWNPDTDEKPIDANVVTNLPNDAVGAAVSAADLTLVRDVANNEVTIGFLVPDGGVMTFEIRWRYRVQRVDGEAQFVAWQHHYIPDFTELQAGHNAPPGFGQVTIPNAFDLFLELAESDSAWQLLAENEVQARTINHAGATSAWAGNTIST